METKQYFRSMSAFCKQRAKMVGEDELFWLTEAELLERLSINAERQMKLATQQLINPLAA
ncbi:hypothetical protein IVB41_25520 [Bradyrhizobium sp. 44]|jgi:hypothetical protein|uniref:hypothetical protein n=1 Tax=unclassified Bradyrhizobium TaxID=2631580 RepID=UPI00048A2FA0|nr:MULTISPECIES: hypothetical protein [unclassified Bradyrhizobium]MCK1287270.1 hypothetical protein [Bradyrhizobium sp. 44]